MFRLAPVLVAAFLLAAAAPSDWKDLLRTQRSAPGDLEVGGELARIPAGEKRYLRYQDLLRLPQETYSIDDDSNFRGKTEISGVSLSGLAQALGQSADFIVAICYDHYRTNYPADYVRLHHPLLVLRINGQEREHWPTTGEGGESMAPYVISHPAFKPAFKVLSHQDEPQIPYGVVRIEFRREAEVFGAIRPPGIWSSDSLVGMGFVIARQDCFRCHNMGAEGGTMAGRSWMQLAALAKSDPARFRRIIRDPVAVSPTAKMPGQPGYDEATLDALTAYFRTFADADANVQEIKNVP